MLFLKALSVSSVVESFCASAIFASSRYNYLREPSYYLETTIMYHKLFQPLTIGPRQAHNRILFGSHTTNLARHNLLSQQHADYYAARAEGGAGLIVLEEHIVHASDMPYESAVLGYLPATP